MKYLPILFILGMILLVGGVGAVECGSTPTLNCYMNANTTYSFTNGEYNINTTGTAMRVKGDNVILDCNGSRIYGNNSVITSAGLQTDKSGYNNITVKNCIFEGYGYGIFFYSASNILLENITTRNNNQSFRLSNISNIKIYRNYLSDIDSNDTVYSTIYLYNSGNNSDIQNNTISGGYIGIFLSNNTNSYIYNNDIFNTSTYGIDIDYNSNYSTVSNNRINYSGWDGLMYRSSGAIINYNNISNSYHHGIDIWQNPFFQSYGTSLIENNQIYKTIYTEGSNPYSHYIYLNYASGNIIQNNLFYGGTNGIGYGIVLSGTSTNKSRNNIIRNNIFDNMTASPIAMSYTYNNSFINNTFTNYNKLGSYPFINFEQNNSENNSFEDGYLDFIQRGIFNGQINYTTNYSWIYNTYEENSIMTLLNLNNALIIFSNGTNIPVYGTNQEYNLTLAPNQYVYVYTDYYPSTHLKLNSNTGTTAYDSSGNENHGTISGATWDNDGVLVSLVEGVDYTLNTATGLLTLGASYLYDYVVASWDYYTTSGNQDYNVAGDMETGLGEFGKWFSLLVVVFIAGVILFLFKDSFKQEGDGQGY